MALPRPSAGAYKLQRTPDPLAGLRGFAPLAGEGKGKGKGWGGRGEGGT